MLDAVSIAPGEVLLDVATGPGTVARLAPFAAGGQVRTERVSNVAVARA